jgi:hypothetical protein
LYVTKKKYITKIGEGRKGSKMLVKVDSTLYQLIWQRKCCVTGILMLPQQELSLAMYNTMQARGFTTEAPISYIKVLS